ncbi:MAG: ATP-binding protein, partial [Rhodoferax sp.]
EAGKYYFLSRPRRFGKSLFIDTLKDLFEGHRELFTGLAAESRWDWSKKYPVIRISFGAGVAHDRLALDQTIHRQLTQHEESFKLRPAFPDLSSRFADLIARSHAQTGQRVVVLVDEYDKPILDNITEPAIAREMRDGLRNLYSVIKDSDAHVKFAMLTGVSKFSKVSLFSGLNNLQDISLSKPYSAICGYTDADIDSVFAPELPGFDRDEIRLWYNGYNWTGTSVYNPFDILLLFQEQEFRPHWFETGTPDFLIQLLAQRHTFTPNLGRLVASSSLLSCFDVDQMTAEALLFQTGYLTIGHIERMPGRQEFTLKYPNLEVQTSLNDSLLQTLTGDAALPGTYIGQLYRLLGRNDFAAMQVLFTAFYDSIPYQWFTNNPITQYEGYYASVFYSYFAACGLDVQTETSSNAGRLDMTVKFNSQIYLFEFKVVELTPDGSALQQIKDKGYAKPYLALGQPIHMIGVEFSKASRSVVRFEVEII